MSADRELLELAAKAAGLRFAVNGDDLPGYIAVNSDDWRHGWAYWNPLLDDGDALRLVVTLRLQIKPGKHKGDGCTVETQRSGIAGCTAFYEDKAQQMRRAIVMAAAEIGRAQ